MILDALGDGETVLNVGAGSGAYEPTDRKVLAVEPSAVMRSQRPAGAAPCIDASAESLPFLDDAFDAAMALMSLHHWSHWRRGVRELRRVARERVVIFTYDPAFADRFWLARDYLPELVRLDVLRFAPLDEQAAEAGNPTTVIDVPIPHDCSDGFLGAFWRRPHAYLDPDVRAGMSTFHLPGARSLSDGLDRLAADLEAGRWTERNRELLEREQLDLGYRLVVAEVGGASANPR